MFIAFIFTISLDYKKARKMDYDLLNACVVLARNWPTVRPARSGAHLGPGRLLI